jgi:hypothetical protein
LNVAENNPTVDSTSLSSPLNIWPRADLSSAALSGLMHRNKKDCLLGKTKAARTQME